MAGYGRGLSFNEEIAQRKGRWQLQARAETLTDRKQAEDLPERLLLNEFNHRVKNTLATIQALTAQTLRAARDLPSAREALERRIHSMAQAHDLLTLRAWTGANLTEVVMRALDAFSSGPSGNVWYRHRRFTKARSCAVAGAA